LHGYIHVVLRGTGAPPALHRGFGIMEWKVFYDTPGF
jgi:hypothetical protein